MERESVGPEGCTDAQMHRCADAQTKGCRLVLGWEYTQRDGVGVGVVLRYEMQWRERGEVERGISLIAVGSDRQIVKPSDMQAEPAFGSMKLAEFPSCCCPLDCCRLSFERVARVYGSPLTRSESRRRRARNPTRIFHAEGQLPSHQRSLPSTFSFLYVLFHLPIETIKKVVRHKHVTDGSHRKDPWRIFPSLLMDWLRVAGGGGRAEMVDSGPVAEPQPCIPFHPTSSHLLLQQTNLARPAYGSPASCSHRNAMLS